MGLDRVELGGGRVFVFVCVCAHARTCVWQLTWQRAERLQVVPELSKGLRRAALVQQQHHGLEVDHLRTARHLRACVGMHTQKPA
jgi:hypothetical protein